MEAHKNPTENPQTKWKRWNAVRMRDNKHRLVDMLTLCLGITYEPATKFPITCKHPSKIWMRSRNHGDTKILSNSIMKPIEITSVKRTVASIFPYADLIPKQPTNKRNDKPSYEPNPMLCLLRSWRSINGTSLVCTIQLKPTFL